MGFDFMEDRPLHQKGAQGGDGDGGDGGGGGGSSTVGVGDPHHSGIRPAPGRPSAHSEQRVASLFDLLQELSVPPKSGGSSLGAQAAGAPRGTTASPLASPLSTKKAVCSKGGSSLDITGGNQQQPSAASQTGTTPSSEEKRRRRDGAGRPVLRREGQQDRNWIGASSTDEVRRVTFAVDEEAEQARSRQSGRGSGDSSSRDCDQRAAGGGGAAAAAITGPTIPSSRSANARPGNDDGNSNSGGGGGGGGGRLANAAATAHVSGATPNSNALGRRVALPAVAAAQAALPVSPVNRPGARQREVELSTRRRRVDDAGGGGGRENSCRRAAGGSARGAAGRQRGPPLGVRENNAAVSGAGPLWREAFPARGGGGGGDEGPRGTTGERRQGKGGTRGGTSEQVDDRARNSSERWTTLPQDGGDEVQWMSQGGDPTTAGVDGSRRWPSASTNLDSFRGGGRGGKGANATRTTSQAEEEGNDVDSGGSGSGSSSGGGGQRGQIARRRAREPSPSAGEDVSPGRARGAKRAKRTVEGRDDGDRGGGTDDGQGLFEGSGDEGCTYFEYEDPATGGAQDDGRPEDNGPKGGPQKELLRVRGLCRMQGSVLALVEWSVVDVDGAASTELSFVLSSTLKAEWPRQYIDYLEAKMVFEEEKNDGA
ncbi:hypothetical protein Esi_0376_0025 [Ectocarpus siliculosus]|uniref:Uncharacterized protein n=1 Tax=Ectocarpus siliculosus TaxID=2880 RepID=D7FZK8_ECTSI|nr:hypothetical protein Esi_0376_0025 [Ectocarpus siliculosus]|eukprot:CBJ32815.1 hypothetical protein Esi_0376_0025 [Ectocarpus siliculosus]